jgi:hypothetical protein
MIEISDKSPNTCSSGPRKNQGRQSLRLSNAYIN